MFKVVGQSWALLLGILLLMIGNGLHGTLLGVRGSLENMSSATMGYIMSAYYVGFLGGSKLTPWLLRRVGHVRVFAALGSLMSAAFILYGAVVHPMAWLLLRLLVGFCICGIYVVAESWLNHSSTNETRGQTLSVYLIVQMLGIVLGQLLLNVGDPAGYDLFVLITVLVSVSFAPMLLSSQPAPFTDTSKPMSIRELVAASPLACFGSLLLGGVMAALFAMSPVYATERELSIAQTSWFVTSIFLGGMLLQYPIGWLSDRMDRRILIIAVASMGAVVAYAAMLLGGRFDVLLICAFLLGGLSNPLYSLLIAHANDYLELEKMSSASGGLLFINGLGAMSGPVLVGFAMSTLGTSWFFVALVILLSGIAVYGLYRATQRPTVPTEEHAPFVQLSGRATYLATGLAIEAAEIQHDQEQQPDTQNHNEQPDDTQTIDVLENPNGQGDARSR